MCQISQKERTSWLVKVLVTEHSLFVESEDHSYPAEARPYVRGRISIFLPNFGLQVLNPMLYALTEDGTDRLFYEWLEGKYLFDTRLGRGFYYSPGVVDQTLHTTGGCWQADTNMVHFTSLVMRFRNLLAEVSASITSALDSNAMDQLQVAKKRERIFGRREILPLYERFREIHGRVYPFDEFERSNSFISCRNGLYDLDMGEFRSTKPSDYTRYFLPVNYDPTADNPWFWKMLDDITGENQDLADLLCRIAAAIVDVRCLPKPLVQFYDDGGNNGCKQFLRLIFSIFEPLLNHEGIGLTDFYDKSKHVLVLDGQDVPRTCIYDCMETPPDAGEFRWEMMELSSQGNVLSISPKNGSLYRERVGMLHLIHSRISYLPENMDWLLIVPFEQDIPESHLSKYQFYIGHPNVLSTFLNQVIEAVERVRGRGFEPPETCRSMLTFLQLQQRMFSYTRL